MHYYKICKYDYDNPDYINDWMTGNEILEDAQETYPEHYYAVEQQFVDVANNFLSFFNDGEFETHHYKFFIEEDDFDSKYEKIAASSNLLIGVNLTELVKKEFHNLSSQERLLVFQLSLRGVAQIGLKEQKTGACFSDMSDGFYWFLALPDDVSLDQIVKPQKNVYVYPWFDIWSE